MTLKSRGWKNKATLASIFEGARACGPVAAAAAIQVSVCSPNFLIQEYNITHLHERILKTPFLLKKGYFIPPRASGLGVEIDEETVKEYPYRP